MQNILSNKDPTLTTNPGVGSIQGTSGSFASTGANISIKYSSVVSSLFTPTIKYDIRYVIVLNDGSCLELDEQQAITPREMIGISKFLQAVTAVTTANYTGSNIEIYWSHLISCLGISRHFKGGIMDQSAYDADPDVLNIFLYDPKP